MNVRAWRLPFRVGATSYIIEDDLVANAAFLASHVQDMQLVLFDLPGGPSNLPDAATVTRLAEIGAHGDLSYTVHLVEDLADWAAPTPTAAPPPALRSALDVIARTQRLMPWAWVAHLDGRAVRAQGYPATALAAWCTQTAAIVTSVGQAAGGEARLAIENLEGYPPTFVDPVVAATAASRCVDVGHLWLDGRDPVEQLLANWLRLRVVHLHSVSADVAAAHRDHRSLALMPAAQLDSVVHLLLARRYAGVLTLEIFGELDFWSSLHALEASVQRYRGA